MKTTLPAEPLEINDWYKYIYASLGYKVGEQTTPIQNTTKPQQNEQRNNLPGQPIQQPESEGNRNEKDGQESN